MKQLLFNRFTLAATVLLTASTVFAQKEKDNNEVQQFIITRKGHTDEKTVIEIKGDKIKINGKDADNSKGDDVTVHVNKFKGLNNLNRDMVNLDRNMSRLRGNIAPDNFNFNFNEDGMSMFSEDNNRAMLGVVTDKNDKGAEITQISEGSAAAKAGLKKGDIITKIEGKNVEDADDVAKIVHSHKPGDKITITYLRGGKEQNVSAGLGKWKGIKMDKNTFRFNPDVMAPNAPNAPIAPFDFNMNFNTDHPKLGLSIQDTEDGKGVKVLEVDEDSNAGKAGIKEGDVITHINDKEVNTADEVSRIVRENKTNTSLSFKVQRNGKAQAITVNMPRKIKTVDL